MVTMARTSITFDFITDKLLGRWWPVPYPTTSFAGKTILVTGSNTGLGLEASRHFVRLGAEKVILAVRNLKKGEAAKLNIQKSTLRLNVIEVWKLDLGSFAGTMEFVERMLKLPRLDVAVLNAGLLAVKWSESMDGWEETLQVNVLSTTLLALHTLKKQIESAKEYPEYTPRLVLVSSDGHSTTTFTERDQPNTLNVLNNKEYFEANIMERYLLSKLFVIYITREIAKLVPVQGSGPVVIVNTVHPGFCFSELGRGVGVYYMIGQLLLARSTEKGSRSILDGAIKGMEGHGQYLAFCQVRPPAPVVTSEVGQKSQKKVWDEVIVVLETKYPGIMESTFSK